MYFQTSSQSPETIVLTYMTESNVLSFSCGLGNSCMCNTIKYFLTMFRNASAAPYVPHLQAAGLFHLDCNWPVVAKLNHWFLYQIYGHELIS